MKFTIRIKLLLSIIPLIILMLVVCVVAYNFLQKSIKYIEKILYQEVPIADVSMEAVIALIKSHVLIREYLLENEIRELDKIEDDFKETVLDFDMFVNAVIYGSESNEFKKIENGKIYDMWIKDGYKNKIIIRGNKKVVDLYNEAEKLHQKFKYNARKMMEHHQSILLEPEVGLSISNDKFEIKRYFAEIDNWNKKIYSLMNEAEKSTKENMRFMIIESNRSLMQVNLMIVIITIFSIFNGIMIYLLFSYSITNQLSEIEESTKEITNGNFNFKRIKIKSRDEIGSLADSFNIMTDSLRGKIEKEKRVYEMMFIHSQKLASIGELSASIVHEIRQPLNVIKVTADNFIYSHNQKKKLPELCKVDFSKIKRVSNSSDKINKIIKNFQNIIKNQRRIEKTLININDEIKKDIEFFDHKLKINLIKVVLDLDESIGSIKFTEINFQQIISNLLNNAINAHNCANKKDKKIIIKTEMHKKYILLEVFDNATGINESIKEKIFEPFFSTNLVDDSMGLGLFIINKILTLNNSSIEAFNNNMGGATFKIVINK